MTASDPPIHLPTLPGSSYLPNERTNTSKISGILGSTLSLGSALYFYAYLSKWYIFLSHKHLSPDGEAKWVCMCVSACRRQLLAHRKGNGQRPHTQRGEAVKSGLRIWHVQKRQRTDHHLRDSNLKDIVLDQLLPQHDDTELYAQLHETASRSTLQEGEETGAVRPCRHWRRE